MRFEDLGLSTEVLQAVADAGYIEPTPIQEKAIPIALQGRDLLGSAQTGTGKTAAFTLPMIDILAGGKAKARMPRSLILTPTRELATQVAENFEIYGKYHKLTQALLIGGVSFVDQESALSRGVDVLTATPGRLLDLFGRGKILLAGVKILVIDEADRMLDMGFIPDVERIVGLLPPLRQTLFFSATMPAPIRRLADKFLQNPKEISVDPPASPAETVSQALILAQPRDKGKVLRTLLKSESVANALIFCNRKRDVAALDRSLRRYGFQAAALHGDMTQPARTETLEAFKAGNIRFLVATDVAGRGLDVFGLSHVFNFDVPTHAEDYVHRIGRTGRAGHRGRAITIGVADDAKFIGAIERLIHREIPRIKVSGSIEIDAAAEDAGRTRGRGRRGRKPAKETAATEPAGSGESAGPAETLDKGKPGAGREKAAEKPARKAEKPPAKKAEKAERQKGRSRRGDDKRPDKRQKAPVVGLGDHVPAFLLRGAAKSGKK
ncbi:MAG: DEAD/DEAH box helicase [Alphaproteobacteria bacterium]